MLADPGRRAGSQSHRSADAATPELDCAEAVQAAPAFDLLSRAAAEVDDVFIDAVVVQLNMLDARRRSGDQRASGGIDQLEGLLQESGLSRKLLMICKFPIPEAKEEAHPKLIRPL